MHLKKVLIENYKCFHGTFSLELNEGMNVLVGRNESGKSNHRIGNPVSSVKACLNHGKHSPNRLGTGPPDF